MTFMDEEARREALIELNERAAEARRDRIRADLDSLYEYLTDLIDEHAGDPLIIMWSMRDECKGRTYLYVALYAAETATWYHTASGSLPNAMRTEDLVAALVGLHKRAIDITILKPTG